MALRLGFHYHIPAYRDSQGQILTPGYLGRFLDSLANQCERLVCFMHTPRLDEATRMDYSLQATNVELVNIGPHASTLRRTFGAAQFVAPLRAHRAELDALLIRGPSPLLPAMAKAAGDLPVALLIVGDYLAGVNDLPQPRWRKEAIRAWSWWNYRQQMAVARSALTFVNSHQLYKQLQPHVPLLRETRTTTLSEQDFFVREDTCTAPPCQLLYTGRMARAKGLLHLGEALEILTRQGVDVVLDLVGWQEKGETGLDELLAFAQEKGLEDRIVFHGPKPVGPELFSFYKNADIYVLASTSNFEGFPRTLWEAMAHSLPVVATRVGSIPQFLEHQQHAFLVEPGMAQTLAAGISTVIHERLLRQCLIAQGRILAAENTLENRADELVTQLQSWVKENHA